jgi:uncharacterized membrane protein
MISSNKLEEILFNLTGKKKMYSQIDLLEDSINPEMYDDLHELRYYRNRSSHYYNGDKQNDVYNVFKKNIFRKWACLFLKTFRNLEILSLSFLTQEEISSLEQIIKKRGKKISSLEQIIKKRGKKISSLEQIIQMKEVNTSFQRMEKKISSLGQIIQIREKKISSLKNTNKNLKRKSGRRGKKRRQKREQERQQGCGQNSWQKQIQTNYPKEQFYDNYDDDAY